MASTEDRPDLIGRLLSANSEVLKLRKQVFSTLRFRLSRKQIQGTRNLKLLVEDQDGDKWLFKFGESSVDGAIPVYEFYHLIGVPTPEIHETRLEVNQRSYSGTIQRFEPALGTLDEFSLQSFDQSGIEDIVHNHILSWVIANNHVHAKQFIVVPAGPSKRVVRIDNSIEWFVVGRDSLDIDYRDPTHHDIPSTGYSEFWRAYMRGTIDVDFTTPLETARLISVLPDEHFRGYFQRGIKNGYMGMQNILLDEYGEVEEYPDLFRTADKNFDLRLVARKNTLPSDLEQFYRRVRRYRASPTRYKEWAPRTLDAVLRSRLEDLDAELRQLKKKLQERGKNRSPQASIRAVVSFEANEILKRMFRTDKFGRADYKSFVASIEYELIALEARTKNLDERRAVGQARRVVRDFLDILENSRQSFNKKRLKQYTQRFNSVFSVVP